MMIEKPDVQWYKESITFHSKCGPQDIRQVPQADVVQNQFDYCVHHSDLSSQIIWKKFETCLAIYLHTMIATKYWTLDIGLDTN